MSHDWKHHWNALKKLAQGNVEIAKLLDQLQHLWTNAHVKPIKQTSSSNRWVICCDGACRGNPGPGAFAAIGFLSGHEDQKIFEVSGVDARTTNNEMELEAALEGLRELQQYFHKEGIDAAKMSVELQSDSKYITDGISNWMPNWEKRGWKKADGKSPEHVTKWMAINALITPLGQLSTKWVKGHSGEKNNEYVDQLANLALDEAGF